MVVPFKAMTHAGDNDTSVQPQLCFRQITQWGRLAAILGEVFGLYL
ncbi:hypothetical protein [Paenibacillus woosongensis]|nr:hypothetical protein [Paenibacillus woosongensis]